MVASQNSINNCIHALDKCLNYSLTTCFVIELHNSTCADDLAQQFESYFTWHSNVQVGACLLVIVISAGLKKPKGMAFFF